MATHRICIEGCDDSMVRASSLMVDHVVTISSTIIRVLIDGGRDLDRVNDLLRLTNLRDLLSHV